MRQFLAELRDGVLPPQDVGVRIARNALVIGEDDLAPARDIYDRAIFNCAIAFRIDNPGGLAQTEAEDDWGATDTGYAVRRLRAVGGTGEGVRIGIADSGIDSTHPAFADLVKEERLTAYAGFAADGSKEVQHDPSGLLIPDDTAAPLFTHWHGTFCAALLVGQDVDGKLRGIAPAASLSVAKVLQNFNNGTVASIYGGLAWLADRDCDVVSLSLGWEGQHDDWAAPIRNLLDRGVVVVAAAGNSFGVPGVSPTDSPANYPIASTEEPHGVLISVGALGPDDRVADSSGGGIVDWSVARSSGGDASVFAALPPVSIPHLVAPGVGVVSAGPGGTYRLEAGTSMAAPHVAGLIAVALQLMRKRRPNASPGEAARLVLSCLSIDKLDARESRIGKGKVDIDRLLSALEAT
jgi:subtilisin family serine protease